MTGYLPLRAIMNGIFTLALLAGVAACGGDDGTGPEQNQPPQFEVKPFAVGPNGTLLRTVPGDEIPFSALAIDPDIEDVFYRWELVPATGAGVLAGADTRMPVWTVGQPAAAVTVWCTISDGRDSTSLKVGKVFAPGTPVDHLTVSTDTTWVRAASPYVILGDLTIQDTATLTLEAGVELQVRAGRRNGNWEKRGLNVNGGLVATGALGDPVTIHGGFTTYPGSGKQQFRGISVMGVGRVDLLYTRIEEADVGLRNLSATASTLESSNFEDCGTGVRIERGPGTSMLGCVFRENSVGVQLNNASATAENCVFDSNSLYGIDVDASGGSVTLDVSGCDFDSNLQSHLRMRGGIPNVISATVRGSNFLPQSGRTPSITLSSNCLVYRLDLRGNFWGINLGPAEILNAFADDKSCDAGVLSWTDFDCGGDPDACDWSPNSW